MSVVTVPQARTHLNIAAATHDAEIQSFLDSCEAAIAKKCGPLTPTAYTERVSGGGLGLVLRHTPVVSLTSVTPVNGSAYDLDLLTLDESSGVIEWTSGARFTTGRYDVEYNAGRLEVPDDLVLAILDFTRDNWIRSQRGGGRQGQGAPTAPAYSYSYAVLEKLQPHIQVGN